jgi:hypothetical protein
MRLRCVPCVPATRASPQMSGAARSATTVSATCEGDVYGCGVDVYKTLNQVKLYRVHGLINRAGTAKALEALRRWVLPTQLRLVEVGKQQEYCVTKAGLAVVLRHIWEPNAAQAQADVQTLAQQLRIDLEAAQDAPESPSSDDEEGEEGEAGGDALPDDDEDDDADFDPDEVSDGEEEAGGWLDDRARPQAPSQPALQASAAWGAYAVRKARRVIMKAVKVTPQAGCVDPTRRLLTTKRLWKILQAAVPPKTFTVPSRHGPVQVPSDGGYLLQIFRVLSGLTEEKHLLRAMNLARTHLEVLFRTLGRKYTGSPLDMALYAIEYGASQAAVEMLASATGACVHYTAASEALRAASKAHILKVKADMQELPEGVAIANKIDNLFNRRRCVRLRCDAMCAACC